jgi:hypothetical protein
MKGNRRSLWVAAFVVFFTGVFFFAVGADALEIMLEPAKAQREVNGAVRVHVYATGVSELISMGVKVSFNPSVLQVTSAKKNEDFSTGFVMDADGNPATTNDQYVTPPVEIDNTNGSVTMIGGRLIGNSTTGLTGQKVLLGWIVFKGVAAGNSNLSVDLGRYNTSGGTFVNFAKLSGVADEPTNVPASLGVVCVVANACEGDVDGNGAVNAGDNLAFRNAFPSQFGDGKYSPAYDMNGDGAVNAGDRLIFRPDFPRNDCPVCIIQ